jgi:hypothetical protein
MVEYNKAQSTVVALWVLAQTKGDPAFRVEERTTPPVISDVVNRFGDRHPADSIFLHRHGYEKLFLGIQNRHVTELQRQVARELHEAAIVAKVYDV